MPNLDRVLVPWELERRLRNRYRRARCALCTTQLDGGRAVASTIDPEVLEAGHDPDSPVRPLWLVHHSCYVRAFAMALRRWPILLAAPSEDAAHEAFRDGITTMVRGWAEGRTGTLAPGSTN